MEDYLDALWKKMIYTQKIQSTAVPIVYSAYTSNRSPLLSPSMHVTCANHKMGSLPTSSCIFKSIGHVLTCSQDIQYSYTGTFYYSAHLDTLHRQGPGLNIPGLYSVHLVSHCFRCTKRNISMFAVCKVVIKVTVKMVELFQHSCLKTGFTIQSNYTEI